MTYNTKILASVSVIFALTLPRAAIAQVNGIYGAPAVGQVAVNPGLQSAVSDMNAQRGLVGPQSGSPTNGPAMLRQAQGTQSSSMEKAPKEGQTTAGGQTVHYQLADPNAGGTGTGSDIVGGGDLPPRVFNDVP